MLRRFFKGRNFGGMLSQLFLPMITAFIAPAGASEVIRTKYAISPGRRQGKPFEETPIPLRLVAATIIVKGRSISGRPLQRNVG